MHSILIVEDHRLLAEAIAQLLRSSGGYEVRYVVESAEDALERIPKMDVDLALVDVSLPKKNGIELVSILSKQFPKLPCLMLSGHTAMHYVSRSLNAGARGYVVKEDIDGLLEALQLVLEGGTYLSKQLSEGS